MYVIADLVQAITEADETNNVHIQAVIMPLLPCPADFNGDGIVGPFDLATLLGNWGPNPGHPADLDGDGVVGPFDLAILLGNWGPCG